MNLESINKKLPTKKSCIDFLEKVRWGEDIKCPYCQSVNITHQPKESRHHCNMCNTAFSVTVGTLFHKTKVDFQKWFYLINLSDKNLLQKSLRSIGEELNVTKDTAAKMLQSIKRGRLDTPEMFSKIINFLNN